MKDKERLLHYRRSSRVNIYAVSYTHLTVAPNGDLTFTLYAHAASSGTRWKTVGLYVTSDPTGRNGQESTKAKDCVFFDKLPKGCSKKDETDRTGIVQLLLPSPKTSLTACVTKPV